MSYNPAKQYKQMQITTANPTQILILLYEGAIQNLKRAVDAIEKKDIATKGKYIGKTHDIIIELSSTLNFEVGGNIAKDLERLYNFVSAQLVKANLENNTAPLKASQKILENLLEGWRAAIDQLNKGTAAKK